MNNCNVYEDDPIEANKIVNNPTNERELHYTVIFHKTETYPQVEITPWLGENQITNLLRRDS